MLLLAVLAGARPVVLAPLALHDALRDTRRGAPGTLNAGRVIAKLAAATRTSSTATYPWRRSALARCEFGEQDSAIG